MDLNNLDRWLVNHPLSSIEVDCAIAVMLKIIDGKCKMSAIEKQRMAQLYDRVKTYPHQLLDSSVHRLIETTRESQDERLKWQVYEQRVLAETVISRPVMKGFKARIRNLGLLDIG